MCGRFAQTITLDMLNMIDIYDAVKGTHHISYNVAPGNYASVVIAHNKSRILISKKWGLVPVLSKDEKNSAELINARAETLSSKPSFRDAYRSRRCLVPVSGFYEWHSEGKYKQPFFVHLKKSAVDDFTPMMLAGLYESCKSPSGDILGTFTVITTSANRKLKKINERMPVIIPCQESDLWLYDSNPNRLLSPIDNDAIDLYPVSMYVNSAGNDSPECIEPAGKEVYSNDKASSIKELMEIPGVGTSLADDLYLTGIRTLADLQNADPESIYDNLNSMSGVLHDRCVLYVFRCAVYYASNKAHDPELLKWWNWKDFRGWEK